MRISGSIILAGILLSTCYTTVANAQSCGKLKKVSSVDLEPLGDRMLVPVMIEGQPQKLLLGTGSNVSTMTASAAAALNLHVMDGSRIKFLQSNGNASRKYVQIGKFRVGNLEGDDIPFMVTPDASPKAPFGGVLATDMMQRLDYDFDFAGRKLNIFDHDHCDGQVVYWPASTVGVIPYSIHDMKAGAVGERARQVTDTHIRVAVTLDGKAFTAVINTSAARSTMSAAVAKRVFGLTPDSPGSVSLGDVNNDPKNPVFGHIFSSLSFGGVNVANPHVAITPDLIGARDPDDNADVGSLLQHQDDNVVSSQVTIGMDVLQHLHLYLASGEQKLYITAANADAAAPPDAKP